MKSRKDNYEQIAEKLSCELLNKLNKDINSINTHEAYEVVDMIKDLEESMYKYDISEAMNQHEYKMTSDTYKSYSPKLYVVLFRSDTQCRGLNSLAKMVNKVLSLL